MRCNICGGTAFLDMPKRPKVRCADCGSLERTRVAALIIDKYVRPRPGASILHIAPERGLSQRLRALAGHNYRAVDLDPERYAGLGAEPFDLCRDVFDLPRGAYDLIVHNHVIEHIECNYTVVLIRLAQALSAEGTMLFSMPILPGHFSDELNAFPYEERLARYGPLMHVRRFGAEFLPQTIGMIFRIPSRYDLTESFTEDELAAANIPCRHWRQFTGASIFRVTRADLRV